MALRLAEPYYLQHFLGVGKLGSKGSANPCLARLDDQLGLLAVALLS